MVFLLVALLLHLRGGALVASASHTTAINKRGEVEAERFHMASPLPALAHRRWRLPRSAGQHFELDSQEASQLLLRSAASVLRTLAAYRVEEAGPYSLEECGYSQAMHELGTIVMALFTQLEVEAGVCGAVGLAVPPPLSTLLYAPLLSALFVTDDRVGEAMDQGTPRAEAALHPDAAAVIQLYRSRLWPTFG